MQFFRSRYFSLLSVAVLIGLVFFAGVYAGYENRPEVEKITSLLNKEAEQPAQVDFAAFWKAWNLVNEKYVAANYGTTTASSTFKKAVTDQEKVYGAIQGLLKSLDDPYTVFFPPEEAKSFQDDIKGNFEGVGMEIGIRDDILTVISPLKGTPAERAGMLAGDKILEIDGKSTADMPVDSAVRIIRGKKGTTVALKILHDGAEEVEEVRITRDVIEIPTISLESEVKTPKGKVKQTGLRPDGVFVIRLYNFSADSATKFRDALQQFANAGSNKLLLDLRSNPGGYLEASVDMASWFLPKDAVVVSESFGDNREPNIHESKGYDVFNKNLKMAILVNRGSASASEILAGALKEHGVAKLVGERTFGKGSVQELVDVTPTTQMKVTVARWLTPKGHSISLEGLKPDIEVKLTPEDVKKGNDPQFDRAITYLVTGK
ncbi:MAG: hypothetical protein A2542_01985 [Parcubacteria group bacterium RIFOXYD2_FULL_52_8]|nr:MAG: hypothetical protein A2542_01985 [Parcubacteria group bacterium RIFOXYD2_FULL_52_8]